MKLIVAPGGRPMLLAFASALCLHAGATRAEPLETSYQYNVKAVCSLLGTFGDGTLAQGTYRTLINVGNPTDAPVAFAVTPAVAGSLGDPPGGIQGVVAKKGELGPDGALSLDCFTIAGFFCPTAQGLCFDFSALDGFVRINSPVELDVTAIYSARPADGEVATIDVEAAAPRNITRTIEVAAETTGTKVEPRMKLRNPLEMQ